MAYRKGRATQGANALASLKEHITNEDDYLLKNRPVT